MNICKVETKTRFKTLYMSTIINPNNNTRNNMYFSSMSIVTEMIGIL